MDYPTVSVIYRSGVSTEDCVSEWLAFLCTPIAAQLYPGD